MSSEPLELTELNDAAAIVFASRLLAAGGLNPRTYGHDGYRIVYSIDPSGPNGEYEWHISVSKNGFHVPLEVAGKYARALIPNYAGFDESHIRPIATHIWVKQSPAQPVGGAK